jgi:hypothetical protein
MERFTDAQILRIALLRERIEKLQRRWPFEPIHFLRDCEFKRVPREVAVQALRQIIEQWRELDNPWDFAEAWLRHEHRLSVKLYRPLGEFPGARPVVHIRPVVACVLRRLGLDRRKA